MKMPCIVRALLLPVVLICCQQGMAADTYNLEEFRECIKTNVTLIPKKKQKKRTGPATQPLDNIRIGYFELNLSTEGITGDDRLITHDNYQLDELNLMRLLSFYFNYVDTGAPRHRQARLQRALSLIFHMFTVNINRRVSQDERTRMQEMYRQFFQERLHEGRENPYYDYFSPNSPAANSGYNQVNNGLALMYLAFLGPHNLQVRELHESFDVLQGSFTAKSYHRALQNGNLQTDIRLYNSPENIARMLNFASLGSETALLIGLRSMSIASLVLSRNPLGWPGTLGNLLQNFLTINLLSVIFNNLANAINQRSSRDIPLDTLRMITNLGRAGMEQFTNSILGVQNIQETGAETAQLARARATTASSMEQATASSMEQATASDTEALNESMDDDPDSSSDEYSDSIYPDSDPGSNADPDEEDKDEIIAQQNALIAKLQEQFGGGATGMAGNAPCCPICMEPREQTIMALQCRHSGFCKPCADRITQTQNSECPICRESVNFIEVHDVSYY